VTPRRATVLAALGAAVVLGAPAALAHPDSLHDRKHTVDSRMSALRNQIESAKNKEGVLSNQIEAASAEISSLEGDIGVLSERLSSLEGELAEHRKRLAHLEEKYLDQTRYLNRLIRDHAIAQRHLEERLVQLYEADQTDAVEILLQVRSLSEAIEQIDFMNDVGRQDREIAGQLERLKIAMREARKRTGEIKQQVAEATAVLAEKTEEAREAEAALVARREALAAARADKRGLLVSTREERHHDEEDLDELAAASAQLAAEIQAAQSSSSSSGGGAGGGGSGGASAPADTTASASGFIWPVAGTVTSGFGYRWGRLHEGIDIAAPSGTAVHAAASGTIIYAGGLGGYGNIVVIDHGGGLSTAYAHLSSIWVAGGSVSQGQAIGAVGCTGSCTGPHLHFEVRVNGSAVDPLGYL
jgi:murein DD-endopeptidase MepM/ murein hydrolase activator NlpD